MTDSPHGSFEIEELEDDDDDDTVWKIKWNHCRKNRGHPTFYSIKEFHMEHLPGRYMDEDFYNCVLMLARLTVRLAVHFESSDRLDRKQKVLATGRLERLIKHDNDGTVCDCNVCQSSGKPSSVWAVIDICTVAHVVMKQTEVTNIKGTLFYDDEETPGLTLEDGVVIESCDVEKDQCKLTYVTCDLKLILRLEEIMDKYLALWEKTYARYKPTREDDRVAIIVSHPHGGPKKISVGRWTELEKGEDTTNSDVHCYKYTTSTCAGSSGAYVFIVGYNSGSWYQGFHQHVHSRTNNNFNFSAYGTFLDK